MSLEERLGELNQELERSIEQHNEAEEAPREAEETPHEAAEMASLSSLSGYGLYRASQMPEVQNALNEKIDDCNESFSEIVNEAKDSVSEKVGEAKDALREFGEKVTGSIKDFCHGVYSDVTEFFNREEKENPAAGQFPEAAKLNEGLTEGREFGLDKCSDAAYRIFNPGVINNWGSIPDIYKKGLAMMYADEVAKAFELENYQGVYIEQLPQNVLGQNNGDGSIHLSETLIGANTTPFEIIDTITHELRHQYQHECMAGFHNVSDEVRNEWTVADQIYNYNQPSCYDPWGYSYNPLEIDSNYAGNTVVRDISSRMFNEAVNNQNA